MPTASVNFDQFQGLSLDTDPFDKDSTFGTSVQNVDFARRPGALLAAFGTSRGSQGEVSCASPVSSMPILGYFNFTKTNGVKVHLGRTKVGWHYRLSNESTWTDLIRFGSSTAWVKPNGVFFYNRFWFVDGIGIWSWDGNGGSAGVVPHAGSTSTARNWPPWGTAAIESHFDRIWTANFVGAPGRIVHSNVGATSPSTVLNTVAYSTLNVFNVDAQNLDDPIVTLKKQYGQVSNLLILKSKSVWTLMGNDAATFDLDILANYIGVQGSRAATSLNDGVYWLDKYRTMKFNGIDPMTSVGPHLVEHIRKRTGSRPRFQYATYLSTTFSAVNTSVFTQGSGWSAFTTSGLTVVGRESTGAPSTWFGLKRSVPCNTYRLNLRFRLPTTSSTVHQSFELRFRKANSVGASASYKGYALVYSNFSNFYSGSGSSGWSVPAKHLAIIRHDSTNQNPSYPVASAHIHSSNVTGWIQLQLNVTDAEILAGITASTIGKAIRIVDAAAAGTNPGWRVDPRSTMFVGWRSKQETSTNTGAMFDSAQVWMQYCDTHNVMGYSPIDDTLHIATASTDGSLPDPDPLVYNLKTQQWATRGMSVQTYGDMIDELGNPRLVAVLRGATAADAKLHMFDSSKSFDGAAMSSYWRTDWINFGFPNQEKTLNLAQLSFEKATGQSIKLLVSTRNNPWKAFGQSKKFVFPMRDTPAQWAPDVPGRFFRITIADNNASGSFNVSKLRLRAHVNPTGWLLDTQ